MALQVRDFPMCCGAKVLCDFGYTDTSAGVHGAVDKDRIKHWLKDQLVWNRTIAFLTVILNDEQKKNIGEIITEVGFKHVSEGYNYGHNNYCHLYVYTNMKPRPLRDANGRFMKRV